MGIIRFSVCHGGVKVRGKVVYKWTRSGNGWETRLLREIAKGLRGGSENSAKNEFNGGTKARIVESSSRLVV